MRHWDPSDPQGDKMDDHMMTHCKEVDWVQVRTGVKHCEKVGNACTHLPHALDLLTLHISEARIEDRRMGCEEALGQFAMRWRTGFGWPLKRLQVSCLGG